MPGEDLDAQLLGLFGQPAADIAHRDDVVAVVVHKARHHDVRKAHRTALAQQVKAILPHGDRDRRALLLPVGDQLVQPHGDRGRPPTGYAHQPPNPFRAPRHSDRRRSAFRRIAAASPEGPAPTITTSYSMLSRSISDIWVPLGSRHGAARRGLSAQQCFGGCLLKLVRLVNLDAAFARPQSQQPGFFRRREPAVFPVVLREENAPSAGQAHPCALPAGTARTRRSSS